MNGRTFAVVLWLAGCRGNFEPIDGTWTVGELGVCSESCTTGVQTRVVECRDPSGELLDDSECVGARPWTTQPCAETGCTWNIGDWQSCTVGCGAGTQDRLVECRTRSGILAPDEHCAGPRPAAAQACNTHACCSDVDYMQLELPPDDTLQCMGVPHRYMIEGDLASMTQRCQELGYDEYGGYSVGFVPADWCDYCNARTKNWDGTAWISSGCNGGVEVLRCCDLP